MENNVRSSNQRNRRSVCSDEEIIARRDVDRLRRQQSRQNMLLESLILRRENDRRSREAARRMLPAESVNNIREDDSHSRKAARRMLPAESVNNIREDDSRSREAARRMLPAESVNNIREDDSRSREVARNNLSVVELNNIRSIDARRHVAGRLVGIRQGEEIDEEFWGDIHKISQRTVVPQHMEDYSSFEQNTGIAKFLSHESLGVVQLQENCTFLYDESAFLARLTHMENVKV